MHIDHKKWKTCKLAETELWKIKNPKYCDSIENLVQFQKFQEIYD